MFKWMPSNDLIAQLAHAGWGALIVLSFHLWGHPLWGAAGVLAYASVKEFAFDKYVEQQSFADNLHDWIYWMAGMLGGLLLVGIRSW